MFSSYKHVKFCVSLAFSSSEANTSNLDWPVKKERRGEKIIYCNQQQLFSFPPSIKSPGCNLLMWRLHVVVQTFSPAGCRPAATAACKLSSKHEGKFWL